MKLSAHFMLGILLGTLCLTPPINAQQKDNANCKDHPLFTRMPDSWIYNCMEKEFDAYEFIAGGGKKTRVEGRLSKITYYPQASAKTKPSELQILRNFENAVAKLGGTVVAKEKSRETFRMTRDAKELWVEVWAEFTGKYGFTIVQKEAMAQDIVANADAFLSDLKTTGHAAVYGIYFDTGKSDIKPESAQAIGEVARLLKSAADLKVYVVGHTDNVGGLEANVKLSQSRADAVTQALVRDHGISVSRLRAYGDGPYAPVSTNDTEEGRAMNRRVELVKQ
jgi:OmpA-OmpF porin, OOP family